MINVRRLLNTFITATTLLVFVAAAPVSLADSDKHSSKGKGSSKHKHIGVGDASDGIDGKIITEKSIYYTGNPLDISLRFHRGADFVTNGEVDAFLVIFSPTPAATTDDDTASSGDDNSGSSTDSDSSTTDDTSTTDDNSDTSSDSPDLATEALSNAIVLPVSNVASADNTKLFELQAVDVSTLPAGTYQLGLILTNPGGDPLLINDWYRGLLGLVDMRGLTVSDEAVDFDDDGDGMVDDDSDGDGFSDDDDDSSDDSSAASTPASP